MKTTFTLLFVALLVFRGANPLYAQPTVAPTLIAPANGATVYANVSTTFSWSTVSGATGYDLQYNAEPIINRGSSTSFNLISSTLGAHTWKVRAKNAAGTGPWSTLRSFTIVGAPTVAPTLIAPANGATVYANVSTTFSWSTVSGATGYDLQYNAEAIIDRGSSTSFNLISSTLGAHTWKVRAKNAAGTGPWSTLRSFTVVSAPTVAPTLIAPANGATVYANVSTTFSWNTVSGATGYDLQYNAEPIIDRGSSTSFDLISNTLGAHTWKVRAKNAAGTGPWSTLRSFTVVSAPTVAPTLIAPANGATVYANVSTTFSWNTVSGATGYDLQYNAEAIIDRGSSTSFDLISNTLGAHTWKVRAKNAAGTGPWSTLRSFTVVSAPTVAPTLIAPANGATVYANVSTTFSWNTVSGATGYDLQYNAEAIIDRGSSTSFDLISSTLGAHTWKVRAKNAAGAGPWSTLRSFTVVSAPTVAPTLIAPANGATVIANVSTTFSWNTVSGATGYDLQYNAEPIIDRGSSTIFDLISNTLGAHTWKVRAKNAAGTGPWSTLRSFTVVSAPTVAPTLIAPADGATVIANVSTTFSWNTVSGATGYDLQYNAEPIIDRGSSTIFDLISNTLGAHTWKVRAKNAAGAGPWSPLRSFTIVSDLSAPTLIGPANGATVYANVSTTFSWNTVSGATGYDLQYNAEPIIDRGSSTIFDLISNTLGAHTWKVRAKNAAGTGPWSPLRSFTIVSDLSAPTLIGPANGATVYANVSTTFSWSTVSGATGYDLQYNAEAIIDRGSSTSFNLISSTLGAHTWKVRAKNAAGAGPWSPLRSFTVVAPTAGITVLVHGYNLGGDRPVDYDPVTDTWIDIILALLQRFGRGQVFVYHRATGTFVQVIRSEFADYDDAAGEKILVHDWGIASNDAVSGHAEAAGEALFVGLIRSGFLNITQPNSNRSFHFIGHSRGTVVSSECIQRMGVYDIPVGYVTYLDPHDFDEEPSVPDDQLFHDPAVQIWTNIRYCDNFWQWSVDRFPPNPSGRELTQLLSNNNHYNRRLNGLVGFSSNDSHGKVKEYYEGTISPGSKPASWYDLTSGPENTGFSLWLQRGGHGYNGGINGFNPSFPKTDSKTFANLVPYYMEHEISRDSNFASPYFMNGNFDLAPQTFPDPVVGGDLAGWSYFGGSGSGHISNGHLELDFGDEDRVHNRIYVPANATRMRFMFKVSNRSGGNAPNTDRFRVVLLTDGTSITVLDSIWLNAVTDWQYLSFDVTSVAASVIRPKFEIVPYGLTSSEVWIDEIVFELSNTNTIPLAPIALTPRDSSTIQTLTPAFQWSPFQHGGDGNTEAGYQFRVRDDLDNDRIVYETGFIASTNSSSHTYSPGAYTGTDPVTAVTRISENLQWGRKYHWHVRYRDNSGDWSGWSHDDPNPHQNFFTGLWVSTKVFLEGPYTDGLMTTTLSVGGLIPLTQPYNTPPWNYNGTENVASLPAGVVDWVLVELRTSTASTTTVSKRAAFIKSDGTIADLDGTSLVQFSSIAAGNYYIVVKHRNHLSVMSASAIVLTSSSNLYDFTTGQDKAYGSDPMKLVGTMYCMFAGDANANGQIATSDINGTIRPRLGQAGYLDADINLNGQISTSDINGYVRPNLGRGSQLPTGPLGDRKPNLTQPTSSPREEKSND